MRWEHFNTLKPRCPVCHMQGRGDSPLGIASIHQEEPGHVIEGILQCPHAMCMREYPIIDGVPILVVGIRDYVSQNLHAIIQREDLGPATVSILGDCCGPSAPFTVNRYYLSTYAEAYFRDRIPTGGTGEKAQPCVADVMKALLEAAGKPLEGPVADIGCSVGRSTFELAAHTADLVLGLDYNFSMIQLAQRMLRGGSCRFPLRREGMVYEDQPISMDFPHAERVDFWVADALALPLSDNSLGAILSLNLLDCVAVPAQHLLECLRTLRIGGRLLMASPYDWSGGATSPEAWLGGHSQRNEWKGASTYFVRRTLCSPDLMAGRQFQIVGERARVPWVLRAYDRCTYHYEVDALVADVVEAPPSKP